MSTFSLGNLRFLDEIGDIEQFSPTERKNTATTAADQISNQRAITTTSIQTSSSPKGNTLITTSTLVESSSLLTSTAQEKPSSNADQSSSSSSSVEFDENLDVLNEFEGSEPNSLHTVDYSENQADPNPAYQSVFTLSTTNGSARTNNSSKPAVRANGSIKETENRKHEENEKEIKKGDHFDFEFNEATFKPRPYRPKSAVKRRSSSDLSEEFGELLNPVTTTADQAKRPAPLSHSFWAEIEQEVLQEENEESEEREEPSAPEKDLKRSREFEEDELEKSESLSSEKDANEAAVRIDEESSKESGDDERALDENLERDSQDGSASDDASNSSANDVSRVNERSIGMLNELKSHINRLLSARSESKADDRLIGELNEIKALVGQPNLNRKLQQIKSELIDEFSQMLAGELNRAQQRNKLELTEFARQLENLEQQFDRQIKSMERNLLDSVNSSINSSIHNSINSSIQNSINKTLNRPATDTRVEQQLARLIDELEQFKSTSLTDARQRDRTMGDLAAKLDSNELSGAIASLSSRIDLILENKKENKLTKSAEGAKSGARSMYSSDDEDSSADEVHQKLDTKLGVKLDAKLDEIKLLLSQICDFQKIEQSQNLNKEKDKNRNENRDDPLEEAKRLDELFTDSNKSTRAVGSSNEPTEIQKKLLGEESPNDKTVECDLCEMTNNIRSNIRSFRTTFYRQKLKTYAACSYTSGFLDRLDQQFKLGDLTTEHDHSLRRGTLENRPSSDLEDRLNSRVRLFIHETSNDVRDSVKQLKQLGNYKFETNGKTGALLDDSHRLKQIQQMRFNINRRLIKLNQMIVSNY